MAGTRLRRRRLVNAPVATPERLPVILLTGFLGAGKTTLLLRWLSDAPATGRRLGVVMNEFGADSVDSQLINRPGLALEQVSGGCVCCAPDNELGNAVTRMVKEGNCDDLVLETSGLADPPTSRNGEPGSSSRSTRWRGNSLPRLTWRVRDASGPPSAARA